MTSVVADGWIVATVAGLLLAIHAAWGSGRRIALGVGLALLLGASLRYFLAPRVWLDAWPYQRLPGALVQLLDRSALLGPGLSRLPPLDSFDVVSGAGLIAAALTPLAIFGHARLLLGRGDWALAATLLLALSPAHIRFSASEVAFIPSLLAFGCSGIAAHTVATANTTVARFGGLLVLAAGICALVTFRPLNIVHVVLIAATPWVHARRPFHVWESDADNSVLAQRLGNCLLLLSVTAVALPYWAGRILPHYDNLVRTTTTLDIVRAALTVAFDTKMNTLLNPGMTSPVLTPLALFGGYRLWRTGARRPALYLAGWFGLMFVGHAAVVPMQPAMQARYHLHLQAPFLMLAGVGLVSLAREIRWLAAGAGLLALFAPLLHRSFIQDISLDLQRESAFLRRHRTAVPEGCRVLERMDTPAAPRFRFPGTLGGGRARPRYRSAGLNANDDAPNDGCTFYYRGLACYSFDTPPGKLAPVCAEFEQRHALSPQSTEAFSAEAYDLAWLPHRERGPARPIELVLFRVESPPRPTDHDRDDVSPSRSSRSTGASSSSP